MDLQLRVLAAPSGEARYDDSADETREPAHAHHTFHGGPAFHPGKGHAEGAFDLFSRFGNGQAGRGQHRPFWCAQHQGVPRFILQLAELLGYGGGRNAQFIGGCEDAARAGDGKKYAHAAGIKVHVK